MDNETQNWTAQSSVCLNSESWGWVVTSLASLLIVVGNLLVIIVLLKKTSQYFRATHWFLLQLACADISVGFTILWIGTLSPLFFRKVALMSGVVMYGTLAAATSTSTLGVLFIAMERYVFILHNNSYKKMVNKTTVSWAILGAVFLPLLVFVVGPGAGWNCIKSCYCELYNANPELKYCFGRSCSQMMTPFRAETLLIGGVSLLLVLIVAIAMYLRIYLKVHSSSLSAGVGNCRRKSEMRMIRTMLLVLSGFILTTGPLALCCVTSFFYNHRAFHHVMRILVIVSTLNSILNPVFYFWRIPEMRRNLIGLCCKSGALKYRSEVTFSTRRTSGASHKSARLNSASSAIANSRK